jgi:predicted metal-dependent hydrolase
MSIVLRFASSSGANGLQALAFERSTRSPRGAAYIALFEQFNAELASILLRNDELLRAADEIVSRALREFPIEDPGAGRVSRELADSARKRCR